MTAQGHRSRLRQKLLNNPDGLFDYEILECILFYAIPRRDTKPMAKALISKFKNLQGVFNATKEELQSIENVGESVTSLIKVMHQTFSRSMLGKLKQREVKISSNSDLFKYCSYNLAHRASEALIVFYLDTKNMLIDVVHYNGSVNKVNADIRDIVLSAVRLGAGSIILIHNHPSGSCKPSNSDIEVTRQLQMVSDSMNIRLIDHFVLGGERIFSIKKMCELKVRLHDEQSN